MAVKIRLRRMGQKRLLSIESSLQIPDPREMVNSSKRLEHTIRTRIPAFTK